MQRLFSPSLNSSSTSTLEDSFDLVVLGAGSGGLAAAKRAASYGARVAIVEGDRVGGTCVIRGCVPKKLLLYGAIYKDYIENASSFGVSFEKTTIDSSVLLSNVRDEVDRLNSLHIKFLQNSGVELIRGWASFIDTNTIKVVEGNNYENQRIVYGKNILIAVGGHPTRPRIPGSEFCWVSDDIFLQDKFPETIAIVGAGYIACEFSSILNGLGVNVIQLVRGDHLLRGFDKELSEALKENMYNNGIQIKFGQFPIAVDQKLGSLEIHTNKGEIIKVERILLGTGRIPRLKGLDLSAVGVTVENGKIVVDENQVTNIPNIYAVGDVSNRVNLTPVAIDEGRALSDRLFGDIPRKVNYKLVPKAVFSRPEIGSVGLTEKEAIECYGEENIKVYRSKFRSMSKSLSKKGPSCLLKLIVENLSQKVIGCHMVGESAAEIIQMASIAITMKATKANFDETMALHPTIAEEFVTMV